MLFLTVARKTATSMVGPVGMMNVARPAVLGMMAKRGLSTNVEGKEKYFDKILIANRGEIACRVMDSCKKLGIKTVAVFSEADRYSKHVAMADEAVCVGPAPSSESYLIMDNILAAVKQTGAQAVHPGYGFLSENTNFAKLLEDNGVAFIGPGSEAIRAMGDKIESKHIAKSAGVNVIPGYEGEVHDIEEALEKIEEIGYPVMIKASAGGGGKGMRVAWNAEEAREGFKLSKAEAKSSFGDDRLLIERFIDDPRHVEIQVLADAEGNAIYVNERECSIQRRNQKVIEEAPCPIMDEETRRKMGEQACALAKHVGYKSAGTVEFLMDPRKNFYFLEMNTRLQVEHPISELISGVDLVEQMIRVAAGHPLSYTQADIGIKGHAIECRVYAEDHKKYLPSIGRLHTYQEPHAEAGRVRTDSGIVEGSEISMYYDPMICKLCTHGETREEALELMQNALDTYVIKGVHHNAPLLREVITHPRFVDAKTISTKFLAEEYPEGFDGHALTKDEAHHLAMIAASMSMADHPRYAEGTRLSTGLNLDEPRPLYVKIEPVYYHAERKDWETIRVDIAYQEDSETAVMVCDDRAFQAYNDWSSGESIVESWIAETTEEVQSMNEDGSMSEPSVEPKSFRLIHEDRLATGYRLRFLGTEYNVHVLTEAANKAMDIVPEKEVIDTAKFMLTPMPGTIVSLAVQEGEEVSEGQEIAVVEAMKMQNSLRAQRSGVVKKIHSEVGASLAAEDIIVEFEDEPKA
eukprot:Clim_evm50s150 gene=Clim_evmTU50s150